MPPMYVSHSVTTDPRAWRDVSDDLRDTGTTRVSAAGGVLYGIWRSLEREDGTIRSLLITRRPNLAMWERSKIPAGDEEAEVRRKLSRRYDLCDWTCVYTTTLLTADDTADLVRWT